MPGDNGTTVSELAWDSIGHYDHNGDLEDWDVLETAAAFTTDTLRREVDA